MDSDAQNKRTDEPGNIPQLLARQVQETPDKAFLFSEADGRVFTYAEFDRAVDATARMLSSQGVGKGDVVSLLMPNCAEYIIAYFACWKLGALAGPVNSLLKEHETAFVMNNSEAKAILVNSEFRERIETIRGELPHLRSVITFDDEAEATREFAGRADILSAISLCDKDADAIIIYTSGTTGKPKGCR
jgi:acyl-CoA synthetase (AMP-forming)/AMP-acid ligase II